MRTAVLLTLSLSLVSAGAAPQSQTLTLDAGDGTRSAQLTMPGSPSRPPVVVLASTEADKRVDEIAAALATHGIASVRVATPAQAEAVELAQWIAQLRNDERFPTLTVYSEHLAGAVAARAARADGLVTRAVATGAGSPQSKAFDEELARVIARRIAIPAATTASADIAAAIAAFARDVPTLGRRGTRAARPGAKRGSPRRVVLTTVGSTRIGIEWGSPQKRGRVIWGTLVPWNTVWMPGADEATTLTTNAPIRIGHLVIPAGDHTFYALPSADRFDLIVSRDVGQFHTVKNAELEIGRVPMTFAASSGVVEGLTFSIVQAPSGTLLKVIWDDREYSVAVSELPAGGTLLAGDTGRRGASCQSRTRPSC